MQQAQLDHIARSLHERVRNARGTVGVYYDATSTFRVSPTAGHRYRQVEDAFPGSIVGVYDARVSFDDFFEDFDHFCMEMGYSARIKAPISLCS